MEMNKFKKLGGEMIPDLGEYVKAYIAKHPGMSIYVGCDSDEVNSTTICYVSTICFYDEFRKDGAHYIFAREFAPTKRKWVAKTGDAKEDKKRIKDAKQENIFNKIWGEVERLAELGLYFEEELPDFVIPMEISELRKKGFGPHQTKLVNLDVDINPDPGLDIPEDLMGKPEEIKRYIDENKHKAGRNKSNLLYDASKAYLDGLGFRTRFKPNAWASSVAADFHVRGAKKRIRKSRKKRLIESE